MAEPPSKRRRPDSRQMWDASDRHAPLPSRERDEPPSSRDRVHRDDRDRDRDRDHDRNGTGADHLETRLEEVIGATTGTERGMIEAEEVIEVEGTGEVSFILAIYYAFDPKTDLTRLHGQMMAGETRETTEIDSVRGQERGMGRETGDGAEAGVLSETEVVIEMGTESERGKAKGFGI